MLLLIVAYRGRVTRSLCIARTGGSQAPLLQSAAEFFLGYLRSELLRRKSRTILNVSGSPWVSLVIAVSALSKGLDKAQADALDPLSTIGTDLTVTLAPESQDGAQGQSLVAGSPAAARSYRRTSRSSQTSRGSASSATTSCTTSSCPVRS